MLRLPPLGAIEAFVIVARLGSIKNAAAALALSPSALSRRVQTLENRLGEPLFERRHQSLVLTVAGDRLLETVAPIIDDLSQAFEKLSSPTELRLRLGVAPLFASHVLMPRLPRLREMHPELHLDIDTAPSLINRLGEGLDAGIVLSQEIDPRFYSRKIGHNRVVLLASKEMIKSGRAPKTVADLRRHTFLIHRDMPQLANYWFEAQNLTPIRAADTIHFDSGQLILDAAASELGIAFMLDTLLGEDPRVAPVFNNLIDSPYEYWFVCRQTAMSSKSVRLFHDWLFQEFNLPASLADQASAAIRAF